MAKNKSKGRSPFKDLRPTQPQKQNAQSTRDPEIGAASLVQLEGAVAARLSEGEREVVATGTDPGVSENELRRRALEVLFRLELLEKRAAAAAEAVEAKDRTLATSLEAIEVREAALLAREKAVGSDEVALNVRHDAILRRELDADAGFAQRNRHALEQLDAEAAALREWLSSERARAAAEAAASKKSAEDAAAAERAVFDEKMQAEQRQLDEGLAAVRAEESRIRKENRDIAAEREILDEDKASFAERVKRAAARELEEKDGRIIALEEQLAAARSSRDGAVADLASIEEANRRFGSQSPEEVLQRLETLQRENNNLKKTLGERPSAEAAERLAALERAAELWETDRLHLLEQMNEAKRDAARFRIAVTELESLRNEKQSLEAASALLRESQRQLRLEVDTLVKGVEGKSPFPSCAKMDQDRDLQTSRALYDAAPDLEALAVDIRNRMALDPETGKELFYSERDVRAFLGGMAMSRLHLLQGISGTGKTSLPLAFAAAIGAGSALVEVQAGWRDRQDLLGHFNTFERTFHELEFLLALYKAGCPAFEDRPFIVVMDEMNLSHPEQYFADLLSALEQDPERQRLVLMTAAVDPAPKLFAQDGRSLAIPQNVWFVGTANHDETTKDFADKTYDRAHVMELPRNRIGFARKDVKPRQPLSLAAMEQSFSAATVVHEALAGSAYAFLQEKLREPLGKRFRVGWGNRLERQMRRYVPVVIAAGGSVGEATDHILATKLLRKIRDRHDNRPEDLVALRDEINLHWKKLDKVAKPERSIALLNEELHRLGQDED